MMLFKNEIVGGYVPWQWSSLIFWSASPPLLLLSRSRCWCVSLINLQLWMRGKTGRINSLSLAGGVADWGGDIEEL